MSESRQQRRARERAEAKGARPGPRLTPSPVPVSGAPRIAQVLEVELGRYAAQDDPADVTWSATWGLREDDVGIEDSGEDLAELVAAIVEDAQGWSDRYDLTIEWTVDGDAPPGGRVQDAVAAAGVVLPTTLTK